MQILLIYAAPVYYGLWLSLTSKITGKQNIQHEYLRINLIMKFLKLY